MSDIDALIHEARGWLAEYQMTREADDLNRALLALQRAAGRAS